MTDSRHLDPEPDLLLVVIQRLRARVPALTEDLAASIEAETRAELGGLRVRIAKRRKHPTDQQRASITREALDSTASAQELIEKHGISRRSLYRYIKRGVIR